MTKERMERLMELYHGIGVETEGGQYYFYEAFGMGTAFEDAVKRVNDTFSGMKWGKYKVFISQSEEVERMVNYHDEEAVIYETKGGRCCRGSGRSGNQSFRERGSRNRQTV